MRLHRGLSIAATLAAVVAQAAAAYDTPAAAPAPPAREAALAAYLDAWNGSGTSLETALSADFVDRTSLLPLDAAMFKQQMASWREQIPDLKITVLERTDGAEVSVLRLRLAGHPRRPLELLPVSAGAVAIEQTERLGWKDGRIQSRAASIDEWTLPLEWMFVAPPALPLEQHTVEPVAEFSPGGFLESIAMAADGTLYVSTGIDGGIAVVDAQRRIRPFAKLDVGPGGFLMCLALDAQDQLFATVNSRNPELLGVWRFDRDGHGVRIAAFPPGSVPNGLAFDGHANLLVADSFGGLLWTVPVAGGAPKPWLRHPWLAPRPLVGRFPGANGLQRESNSVIVAVSDRSLLIRIPIGTDGSAGDPVIVSASLAADDFAAAADGTLYVTTHPFNSVVRLERNGRQTVIAGPAQGIAGPTSAVLGRDGWLYVATDGGLYRPLPGLAPRAAVKRIRVAPDSAEPQATRQSR